jgi:cytochrome b561
MNGAPQSLPRYALTSRLLHWSMAAMVLSMFFIGASMVTSLTDYGRLVAIHRPLGIAILVLVVVRYVNRRLTRLPDFLETMSSAERRIATWSERLLYALMLSMPLSWGTRTFRRFFRIASEPTRCFVPPTRYWPIYFSPRSSRT